MTIKRVNPGDLVTADLMNQIIDEINRLSKAVAASRPKRAASVASPKGIGKAVKKKSSR